jgi:hypothetical protein
VAKLLLGDLDWYLQIVEQRRMDVAELMPCRPSEAGRPCSRLEHALQQL